MTFIHIDRRAARILLAIVTSFGAFTLWSSPAGASSGIITVPAGTTRDLTEDHYGGIVLGGSGAVVNCHDFRLIAAPAAPNTCGSSRCGVVIASGAYAARISNCHIVPSLDGTVQYRYGIWSQSADRLSVENSSVYGSLSSGLYLLGGTGNPTASIGIRNNVFSENGIFDPGNGITFSNVNRYRIVGNTIVNNGRDGIDMGKGNGHVMEENTVMYNGENGIEIDFSDYNTIRNNFIYLNGLNGISVDDGRGNILSGNTADSNGNDGIRFQDTDACFTPNQSPCSYGGSGDQDGVNAGNTVDGNTCTSNTQNGIYAEQAEKNGTTIFKITNNTASDNLCDGIKLDNFDDGQITANLAENNHQYGYHKSSNSDRNNENNPLNNFGVNGIAPECHMGSSCMLLSGCPWQ